MTSAVSLEPFISIQADEILELLNEFPEVLAHNAKVATRQTLSTFRKQLIRRSSLRMRRGSGGLARRWFWYVSGSALRDIEGVFYTTSKVARIHEYGGTIRAGRTEYLAIPIAHALTATGRAKKKYRHAGKLIGSAPSRFRLVKKPGNALTVYEIFGRLRNRQVGPRTGALIGKQTWKPIYRFVKSVTIPAKLRFRQAWDRVGQYELTRRMDRAIAMTLKGKKIPGVDPGRRERRRGTVPAL